MQKDWSFSQVKRVNNPKLINYRTKLKQCSKNKQFIENKQKSSSYKEHMVNALASRAEEGRDKLR